MKPQTHGSREGVPDDSFMTACRKLGIQGDINIKDDHIVTSTGIVYCHTTSHQRMCELQRSYGTERVVYTVDPSLLLTISSSVVRSGVFLIAYSVSYDESIFSRLLNHLKERYKTIAYLKVSECTPPDLMTRFRSSDFILSIGANRFTAGLIISSSTPFVFLDSTFGLYSNVLKDLNLEYLNVSVRRYEDLKSVFKDVLPRVASIRTQLETGVSQMRSTSKISSSFTPQKPSRASARPKALTPLYIPSLHKDDDFLNELLSELAPYSSGVGIYLDIAVTKTFTVNKHFHLYPWIGVIETTSLNGRLFELPEFKLSLKFCLGLLVFTDTLRNEVQERMRDARISTVDCSVIPIPSLSLTPSITFNISSFNSYPRAVKVSTSISVLSLPRSSPSGYHVEGSLHQQSQGRGDLPIDTVRALLDEGYEEKLFRESSSSEDEREYKHTPQPLPPVKKEIDDITNFMAETDSSGDSDSDEGPSREACRRDNKGSKPPRRHLEGDDEEYSGKLNLMASDESDSRSGSDNDNPVNENRVEEVRELPYDEKADKLSYLRDSVIAIALEAPILGLFSSCMSRGTPVIISSSSRLRDVVGSSYPLLVDVVSTDSIARAVSRGVGAAHSSLINNSGKVTIERLLERISRTKAGMKANTLMTREFVLQA